MNCCCFAAAIISPQSYRMETIISLARQPLFRLIGAIIVLLITDYRPVWGIPAGIVWFAWIMTPHYLGHKIIEHE